MKAETTVQLQVGDVLGMIGSHIGMKYNKKVTEVKPVFKLDEFSVKVLSHFEVRFEQELSDTFGE